jgi:hypothetical protein
MCLGPYVMPDIFVRLEFTWILSIDFLIKVCNIKFRENASSNTRVVPWGRMYGKKEGQTDDQKNGTTMRS